MPTFRVNTFSYIAEDVLVECSMKLDLPPGEYLALPHIGAVEMVQLRRVWYEYANTPRLEVNLNGRPLNRGGTPDKRKPPASDYLYMPVYPNEVDVLVASFPEVMIGTCFNGRDSDGMQRRGQEVQFTRQEVADFVRAHGQRVRDRAGV